MIYAFDLLVFSLLLTVAWQIGAEQIDRRRRSPGACSQNIPLAVDIPTGCSAAAVGTRVHLL